MQLEMIAITPKKKSIEETRLSVAVFVITAVCPSVDLCYEKTFIFVPVQ